jgi:hypothetical protein
MAMILDLSDEEARALLNLLIEVIEADRYPHQVRRSRRAAAATRRAEYAAPGGQAADTRGARSRPVEISDPGSPRLG